MNALLEDIKAQCQKIWDYLQDLPSLIKISAQQVVLTQLSELAKSLGLVTAGEFRVGNGKEPGQGFTGVRIAYPPMLYNGEYWYDVSVDNDVLQTGRNISNGSFYAGIGNVIIDKEGITIRPGTGNVNKIKYVNIAGYTCGSIFGNSTTSNDLSLVTSLTGSATACSIQLVAGPTASFIVSTDLSRLQYDNYFTVEPNTVDRVNAVRFTNVAQVVILSIDTDNKRVGINTIAPYAALHVNGDILVGGDSTGYAGTIGFTNVTTTLTGSNHGTVDMGTGRPNTGWHKIMIGTTPAYVPYWTDIS